MDAVAWLQAASDPSVRYLTLVDVLGRSPRSSEARAARAKILEGPRVRTLLRGQRRDGSFGLHPYTKWTGAHWRLVSLVELAVPARHPRVLAATAEPLAWLLAERRLASQRRIEGRTRIHASQEGNALAYCVRLGMARDRRVRALVERLLETQWPDGGWNCDERPSARTSSFYETITPLWGLSEYAAATGNPDARAAAARAAELFLERRLFRSRRGGEVINRRWLELRYPLYWHYDILHGLLILSRAGALPDPRADDALDLLEAKRRRDGTWSRSGSYWSLRPGPGQEVVDWGSRGPNDMITLNALRVLGAAGRFP